MAIVPVDQLDGYIWINGELVRWKEAKVHVLTHSLHYSGAVFEGERAYNGKVFKLEEHTERLLQSANTLRMKVPYSFDDIINAHTQIIDANGVGNAYVRPLIWRGAESQSITSSKLSVNVMVVAVDSTQIMTNDLKLHISRWHKPHPDTFPPQCKSSGHYNIMIISQSEAKDAGYDDAILLDFRGYIAECTTSNIFFVKGDKLITPIADCFLNGITRQTIITLAKKLGLTVKEEHITLDKISKYDEAFVTGTAAEVLGIESIDLGNEKIIFDQDHRITKLLQQEYALLVGK